MQLPKSKVQSPKSKCEVQNPVEQTQSTVKYTIILSQWSYTVYSIHTLSLAVQTIHYKMTWPSRSSCSHHGYPCLDPNDTTSWLTLHILCKMTWMSTLSPLLTDSMSLITTKWPNQVLGSAHFVETNDPRLAKLHSPKMTNLTFTPSTLKTIKCYA